MKDYFTTTSTLRCFLFVAPIYFMMLLFAKQADTYIGVIIATLIAVTGDALGYIYESSKKKPAQDPD